MTDFYAVGTDPYCYPETNVLINRFGVKDADSLSGFEAVYCQHRLVELFERQPIHGFYGLTHLQNIHRFVFQDIYPWAGKLRTVRIHKGDTTFAYPEHITSEGRRIFGQLRQEDLLRELPVEKKIERLAWYISELNVLHPFREGNGRALRAFIRLLLFKQGFHFHSDLLEPDAWLRASVAAYTGSLENLKAQLARIIVPIEE